MSYRVEIYAAEGVAIAVLPHARSLRDMVEGTKDVLLENATWHPLDGGPARLVGDLRLPPDDIHVAVSEAEEEGPVHAQWHDVAVDVGPYRVTGQMPTMPGFDPGRALARPTGEFVLLRDVQIVLLSGDDTGSVRQRSALVNRYVVDRVEADLMLGFFFPGAEMVVTRGGESDSAETVTTTTTADPAAAAPAPATQAALAASTTPSAGPAAELGGMAAEVGGPASA
jgi:hypothetical protein